MNSFKRKLNLSIVLVAFVVAVALTIQQIWNATRLLSIVDRRQNQHHQQQNIDYNNDVSSIHRLHQFQLHTNTPPTNIYVLGERNSGTNYVANILRSAFHPPNQPDASRTHEYFSSQIPLFQHKHMFRHSLLTPDELSMVSKRTDILWILAVRSPCEWAEGMYRLPWHMCYPKNISRECPGDEFIGFEHHETLKGYTLQDFWEMEWGDWPESSNFRNLSFVSDDFVYDNVFALRRHKLQLMKQVMETVPRNVKIVRLHELERSPETFIQNLILEFQLKLKEGYQAQLPSPRIHTEKCFKREEWEIAQREINWRLEGEFGFTFLDCHMCYNDR